MRGKTAPVLLCLILIFGLAGCKAQKPLIPDETQRIPGNSASVTDASEKFDAEISTNGEAITDSTVESTNPPAEKDSNRGAAAKPSSRPAVSTPAPSRPASSEPAKPPSSSSASSTASASSNTGTLTPKTYRAEDLGMTYAQMEDRFRSYAESRGLVYDASFTVENAGFTGRVTSFGETWESFYRVVVRWMDEEISMYAPRAVRVQLVRSEDNTFEYAYVLWM